MANGGKGDARRPGTGYQSGWERIFKPEHCPRCGGRGHVPEDCKWPVEDKRKNDGAN